MKIKKILQKKELILTAPKIIRRMRKEMPERQYQGFLKFIDYLMIEELGIKKNQIPWLNGSVKKDEWSEFVEIIRLAYVRFFTLYDKQHFMKTIH
jgi:hypothetical protein